MKTVLVIFLVHLIITVQFIFATTYTCDPRDVCGCTPIPTVITSRIVGGEAAANDTWGWMLSLRIYGRHRCGASLLSPQFAVTAAHCVADVLDDPSALSIVAGTTSLNDESSSTRQRRTVSRIISHPNYDPDPIVNDIAIIQFSPLTISSNSSLAIICLLGANQDPFRVGDNLLAIGWGYTAEGTGRVSASLQQVTVQVFSWTSTDCSQAGLKDSRVQFCAGSSTGGKDTCQGDSGGPLMAFVDNRWILAGITSSGIGCARAGYPGLYTRISAFIPFIESSMNTSSDIPITIGSTTRVTTSSSSIVTTTLSTTFSRTQTTSPRTTVSMTTVSMTITMNQLNYTQRNSRGNGSSDKNKHIVIFILLFFILQLLYY